MTLLSRMHPLTTPPHTAFVTRQIIRLIHHQTLVTSELKSGTNSSTACFQSGFFGVVASVSKMTRHVSGDQAISRELGRLNARHQLASTGHSPYACRVHTALDHLSLCAERQKPPDSTPLLCLIYLSETRSGWRPSTGSTLSCLVETSLDRCSAIQHIDF
jgi:hypothetical protein